VLDPRERQIVEILWREGRLSRWELHERSGITPNGVGNITGGLIRRGVLRECPAAPSNGGRPRIPLELDPIERHVIGISITPGALEACRLNLPGHLMGKHIHRNVEDPRAILATAGELVGELITPAALAIGVSVTGLVDTHSRTLLLSSSTPGQRSVSLAPLYAAAGNLPIVLTNDMQALAARWMLTHRADLEQDILLIYFSDGSLGSAMLIDGRPNRGCVTACNELGHTRMPVDTEPCFCGQTGCLERICSSTFLHRRGVPANQTLRDLLASGETPPAVEELTNLLAMGIANAANFVRPHRIVLVSEFVRYGGFTQNLLTRIKAMMLQELTDRTRIDMWDQPASQSAETAGWGALASLFTDAWNPIATRANEPVAEVPTAQ